MGKQIGCLTAFVVLWLAVDVRATIIELPLDCAGTYKSGDWWTTDFDLGISFIEISHVYMYWKGEIAASRAVYYDNSENPFLVDVGLLAGIGTPLIDWKSTKFSGGVLKYPDAESFDLQSEFENGSDHWNGLLDGSNTISIEYTAPIISNGYFIESGTVILNNATLVIDGTPIPEPATIILLSVGVGGILARRTSATRNARKV